MTTPVKKKFVRKPKPEVAEPEAYQVETPGIVELSPGVKRSVRVGDYVIEYADGSRAVVSEEAFQATYDMVEPEPAPEPVPEPEGPPT